MEFGKDNKENLREQILNEIIKLKENSDKTWKNIADLLNEKYNLDYTPSKYQSQYLRSDFYRYRDQDRFELEIQRVKNRDVLNQANAYIRRLSREDSIKEIAKDFAKTMSDKKLLPVYFESDLSPFHENAAILCISDWHYGIEIDNYWNKYNPEIARHRITTLRDRTIEYCVKNDVHKLCVVNLSDLIAGRIHAQIRYQSRFDVITQIMEVSELLAEFLTDLSKFFKVEYRDCIDNHSRLEPNKKESLDLESLVRITTWYLKERLKNTDIDVFDNTFGNDIIFFELLGHKICAVHGDKDKPESVIKNLTMMTKENIDLILTAHRHHFSADETNGVVVVANGSLMGTDAYAASLRLHSDPSQNLIITTKENVVECIYRMIIK